MLRTAPPETIEQAHAEAFAKLTPEQRRTVLADVSAELPPAERATSDDPKSLARMATRAEMRSRGTMERALGGGRGGGMGMGGMIAGSVLAGVAGAFIGTASADTFFDAATSAGTWRATSDPPASGSGRGGDPGQRRPPGACVLQLQRLLAHAHRRRDLASSVTWRIVSPVRRTRRPAVGGDRLAHSAPGTTIQDDTIVGWTEGVRHVGPGNRAVRGGCWSKCAA